MSLCFSFIYFLFYGMIKSLKASNQRCEFKMRIGQSAKLQVTKRSEEDPIKGIKKE